VKATLFPVPLRLGKRKRLLRAKIAKILFVFLETQPNLTIFIRFG
jgi:hypothetical protein